MLHKNFQNTLGFPLFELTKKCAGRRFEAESGLASWPRFRQRLIRQKNTLYRVAREIGADVELVDGLIEGAFGLDQTSFKAKMLEKANAMKSQVDVLLFAQGSMAYCEDYIAKQCNMKVLSSPRFGAKALRDALKSKGVL